MIWRYVLSWSGVYKKIEMNPFIFLLHLCGFKTINI
jgi:hypothetical protein